MHQSESDMVFKLMTCPIDMRNQDTPWCKRMLILSVTQLLLLSALEGYIAFGVFNSDLQLTNEDLRRNARALKIYHVIFIIAQLFQGLFAANAYRTDNTVSLLAVIFLNTASVGYSFIQQKQFSELFEVESTGFEDFTMSYNACIAGSAFFLVASVFVTWKMHKEIGWKVYKNLGADIQLRYMYRWHHVFMMLLQMDIFFYVAFALQFILLVLLEQHTTDGDLSQRGTVEITINAGLGIVSAVTLFLLGYLGTKRESRRMMTIFIVGTMGIIGYFIWKLAQIMDEQQSSRFVGVRNSLTYCVSLCILLGIVSAFSGGYVRHHFGKGLKQFVQ